MISFSALSFPGKQNIYHHKSQTSLNNILLTIFVLLLLTGIRTSLYAEEPSAFANSALTEAFWCREAWPLLMNLLSDVHGISMIDGEKQGFESAQHRNHERRADMESAPPRKRSGAKLDLVAHDFVNKLDWFVVENPKEWDQHSTKFLAELGVKLFRNLHLIAVHRLAEAPSADFREEARFFSIYAGGEHLK